MEEIPEKEILSWGAILTDGNQPLVDRYNALRHLKRSKTDLSIDMISKCFSSKSDLLKHDLAYSLGQMANEHAIHVLHDILNNEKEAPIVRHEAGEALAAIGHSSSSADLTKHSKHNNKELAETCYIGAKRIEWLRNHKSNVPPNPFNSIDPAPEYEIKEKSLTELSDILLNAKSDIFEKYRALFTLRRIAHSAGNDGNKALTAIGKALKCPSSALFRHQVAFVLGQIGNVASIPALQEGLGNLSDLGMVRHECAEALGSMGNDDCKKILHQFLNDKAQVVKETCVVALGVSDYSASEHF